MKLTHLKIQNFLGARAVDVSLTTPVTIFTGKNGAGKSSVQEAVRMALSEQAVRVGLKKDYCKLVTEGAKSGFAEVEIDGTIRALVTLPNGKTTLTSEYGTPSALHYVLDAQRFARLDTNERRTFLFGLMGLSAGGTEVKKRLLERGCDDQKIETIMPMLRAGFDAAHKEAQAKARDSKTEWRTITGETYGDKKAATWAAEKPAYNAKSLLTSQQELATIDANLAEANQRLGAFHADKKRHDVAKQQIAGLRDKAARSTQIKEQLAIDEASLKTWEAAVESARQRASGGRKVGLIHDLAYSLESTLQLVIPFGEMDEHQKLRLREANATLGAYSADHGKIEHTSTIDIEARQKLPGYEESLLAVQKAVEDRKRELAEADTAKQTIIELEAASSNAPDQGEINAAQNRVTDLTNERTVAGKKLTDLQNAERQANQADERTAKALAAHQSVVAWGAIADALAPDGIPGEILAEAINPLNQRLESSSECAEWLQVRVTPDMEIMATTRSMAPETRPYALLSESEKWRADAMLAEAFSFISGLKILVLDRFDVLDLKGRGDLIAWLDILANEGEINTALLFGTLKALPANLPSTIQANWLENGAVAQQKEPA